MEDLCKYAANLLIDLIIVEIEENEEDLFRTFAHSTSCETLECSLFCDLFKKNRRTL